MQTLFNRNSFVAAFAAVTIIGFAGLMLDVGLDRSYESALRRGTVEIREAVASGDFAIAVLPTVEEIGS